MNIPIYTTTLREDLHFGTLVIQDWIIRTLKSTIGFVSEIDVDS